MNQTDTLSCDERSRLASSFMELVGRSWMAQAVNVAAELRIADFLAAGPKTAVELAQITETHAPSLQRLLRALVTIDICRQHDDNLFEITPLGSLLKSDSHHSLRSWTMWWGAQLWPIWGHLSYSVRTGHSARKLLMGTEGFEHLQRDPAASALFNQTATELTRLVAQHILRAYDFSPCGRITDVGGGCGELLAAILQENRMATGILFDLPHAMNHGRQHLEAAGLASRCEFIAGDFFESVPAGADAYILKSVIHDWNDDRARLILKNCRQAMGDTARLLLIEEMLPSQLTTSSDHQALARSDLNMLVALAAQERTAAELRNLLAAAGFRVLQMIPVGLTFTLLEAAPEPCPVE